MNAIFMAYLEGSVQAVDFYCKAFRATAQNCFKSSGDDDFYAHAEIVISDRIILAISETAHYDTTFTKGNSMQFWLTYDDEQSMQTAYDILKENAEIHYPLSPGEWCKTMADLTDKYGINWLLSYPR
ncbi:hypothetical protein FACS1894219_06870 [Clostridia bacterium]|nr:hypothetical protein FACS1894219_06870 [Clostridia bacterium]